MRTAFRWGLTHAALRSSPHDLQFYPDDARLRELCYNVAGSTPSFEVLKYIRGIVRAKRSVLARKIKDIAPRYYPDPLEVRSTHLFFMKFFVFFILVACLRRAFGSLLVCVDILRLSVILPPVPGETGFTCW